MQADLIRDLHPDETLAKLTVVWTGRIERTPVVPPPPPVVVIRRDGERTRARIYQALTRDFQRAKVIAKHTRIHVDTVRDALAILVRSGLVEVIQQPGPVRGRAIKSYRRAA